MTAVGAIASVQNFKSIQMNNECDVKNQIFLGSVKTSQHSQASKQYMSLKYFYGSILGLGLSRGHLYSSGSSTASSDLTKEQTNSCRGGKQFGWLL